MQMQLLEESCSCNYSSTRIGVYYNNIGGPISLYVYVCMSILEKSLMFILSKIAKHWDV